MMLRTTSVLALGLFLGLAPVHAQTQTDTNDTTAQQGQQLQSEQQQATGQGQQQADQQQAAGSSGGLSDNSMMVDEMIGTDVYSQDGEESIGSIDDVLISVDGQVEGVVVGVGGWLGVGQRDVLMSFDQISLERQEDEFRLVSRMSREELESRPEFQSAETRQQRDTTAMQQPGAAGQEPGSMGQQTGTTVETDTEQRETTATRQQDTAEQGETVAEIEAADNAQVEQDTAQQGTAQQGTAQQDTAQQDTAEQGETVAEIETADEETAQVEQEAQQQQPQQQQAQQQPQQQDGRVVFQDDDTIQASTMLGTSVRSQDDEDMGEINDIIVSLDGNVEGYVVGVGGFLGIGQKDVILSTERIEITRQDDDVRIIALETRENLESAPAFERPGSGQQETMQQGQSQTQQETQTQD